MEKEMIELNEHRAIIGLPEEAVEVTVNAKIFHDGALMEVSMSYDMSQIREMFRKADDGYIDDDDVFTITEKGRAWLEEQERNRKM